MSSARGTLRDPILERVEASDPEEFERCVTAIGQLNTDAAIGLANLATLPESAMAALAAHVNPSVRCGIAGHPACPEEILQRLAQDPDTDVRRAVAANQATPGELLLRLASDHEELVRFEVGRNERSPEQAMAVFVLASTPELITRARESQPYLFAEENPALSEIQLRSMTEQALGDSNSMQIRSNLAKNPNLPEDLVPKLVQVAWHRWEWRSLWGRGLVTGYQQGVIWPSTHAFMDSGAPHWLRESLGRYGHPAALVCVGVEAQPPFVEPWRALRDLINSELLVRALWRELALAGAVKLVYWNDTVEGDHFFPQVDGLNLMDGNTAAEYLIGGYSESREWIDTEDSLEAETVLRRASGLFEDWFFSQADDFTDESLALFALAGVAWAEEMGSVPIRWTDAGQSAVDEELWNFISEYADSDDYDTKVTVVESRLPDIGYAATSDGQKAWLTELIRQARDNAMMSAWGISDHLLMCIALHPATPQAIRDQLLMDPSERVRLAAQKAMVLEL